MLTRDENIVQVPLTVQFNISDVRSYVLNVNDPIQTLQQATDSAIRHVVGSTDLDAVLGEGRERLASEVELRLQDYLDSYGTGIRVIDVTLQRGEPPEEVRDAFDDVNSAEQDQERLINVAEAYRNQVLPQARGQAQRLIEEANAYAGQLVARAEGNKRLLVDSFAKFRIVDVANYYRTTGGDEAVARDRLAARVNDGLRNAFGVRTQQEVVSGERDILMKELTEELNLTVAETLGVEVLDVRVKRIDLPEDIRDDVYRRMRTDREKLARESRSRGQEEATKIQADADRQRVLLEAEAFRQSEEIRGQGDAEAAAIYADAYNRNPEFYSFLRSLNAYQSTFGASGDLLVIEPDSIEEVLAADALAAESLRRQFLDLFECWGYDLVIPPAVEFTDSLLTGMGADLNSKTIKFTDQVSGKTMGFRADISPQTARIDARGSHQGANRLCYVGTVLYAEPEDALSSRAPSQIGAELFGVDSVAADLEVILMLLQALSLATDKPLTLDLGHVSLCRWLQQVCQQNALPADELLELIQSKRLPELQAMLHSADIASELEDKLLAVPYLLGGAETLDAAEQVFQAVPEVMEAIGDLRRLAEELSVHAPETKLFFDLGEMRGSNYHTGVVFGAYVEYQSVAKRIANGGRYNEVGAAFGRARPATGFSTDLKLLVQIAEAEIEERYAIYAPVSGEAGFWDQAREVARGSKKIGTTGRGIGPAYEDKVARRGLRLSDLAHPERFSERLETVLEYHNFRLEHYFKTDKVDFQQTLDQALAWGEELLPMAADVAEILYQATAESTNVMFEGAQGTLLDIDHGTYPFVTSSNTTAGGAATGTGLGPLDLDYVLGITKAYTTRVGSGPFPTELFCDVGEHLAVKGHEVGTTTGRARRTGWFDAVALRQAAHINSLSGLCITKLDVLDGLETVKICTAYKTQNGEVLSVPKDCDDIESIEPVYEELPGWTESTFGVQHWDALPENARSYVQRLSEVIGAPVDIVSTGPDRSETILLNHPFES
eukprot:g4298.t1